MTPELRSDGILISLNNWVEVPRDDAKFEQLREFLREAFRAAVQAEQIEATRIERERCAGIARGEVAYAAFMFEGGENKGPLSATCCDARAASIADAIEREGAE